MRAYNRQSIAFDFRLWVALTALLMVTSVRAQQEWGYSQYLFNLYDVNAAYAGNHHSLSAAIRHRTQWVGMDGAPQTQNLSLHAPVFREKLGIGMRLQRESIGARDQWIGRCSAAYRIPVRDGSFSFALAGGMIRQQIDPAAVTARDWNDDQLSGQYWTSTSFAFDAALFVHTTRWFAGLEADRLNRSRMHWSSMSRAQSAIHLNAVAGYFFKLSGDDLLLLSAMVRTSEPGIVQSDANVTWLWNNKLWLGVGYRTSSGPVFLTELNITRQVRVGYSYDMNVQALQGYQNGSHEVFVGYNLKPQDDRSIRLF